MSWIWVRWTILLLNGLFVCLLPVTDPSGSADRPVAPQKRKVSSPTHSSNGHSPSDTSPSPLKKKKKPGAVNSNSKDQVGAPVYWCALQYAYHWDWRSVLVHETVEWAKVMNPKLSKIKATSVWACLSSSQHFTKEITTLKGQWTFRVDFAWKDVVGAICCPPSSEI